MANSIPDWVPWWAQLLLLVAGVMIMLAFVMMPFSVFGLKSRLEAIEARIDEIGGEIRVLALRLPEPESLGRAPAKAPGAAARPPTPPASWTPDAAPRRPIGAGVATERPRMEPRIDRFR